MPHIAPLDRALRRLSSLPFCHRVFRRLWPFISTRHRLVRTLELLPPGMRESVFGAEVIAGAMHPTGQQIAIVAHELSASGVPRVALEIALAVQDRGARATIFSPSGGPFAGLAAGAGATVVIDPTVVSYLCNSAPALDAAELVFVNSAACFKTVLRLHDPSRCIWYFHETGLIDVLLQSTGDFARAVRRAGAVWAVSDLTRRRLHFLRPDVEVVPAGIRALPFSVKAPKHRDDSPLRLALIGGIEPRKGHDLLADALRRLPADALAYVEVVAYGAIKDVEYAAAWRNMLTGLAGFTYGGALAPEDVGPALQAFDGVIIPSRDEPFSLVALEAMSCGRLVLCTRWCGVSEHLRDGVDAFIADDAEPASLVRLIHRVLGARDSWPEVRSSAMQTFDRLFSQRAFARHVHDALR